MYRFSDGLRCGTSNTIYENLLSLTGKDQKCIMHLYQRLNGPTIYKSNGMTYVLCTVVCNCILLNVLYYGSFTKLYVARKSKIQLITVKIEI